MKTPSKVAQAVSMTLISSILFLTGCGAATGSPDIDKKDAVVSIPVEAMAVSRGAISSMYRTTSTLEAKADAEVNSKATGLVQTVLVEEGDAVEAEQHARVAEPDRADVGRGDGRRRRPSCCCCCRRWRLLLLLLLLVCLLLR